MKDDATLAKMAADALNEYTIAAEPSGVADCLTAAKKMLGTTLATIIVNTDTGTGMKLLAEAIGELRETIGIDAHVDVLEVPECSTRSH